MKSRATAIPLDPPAANRLMEIHVPTLILIGEYDTTGTLAKADKLNKDVPGARQIVFPGAAHMLPMEQSQRFNDEIFNFLK
jgi:pimeloyl-ACP methyl ester carboxylesterase